MTEHDGEIQLVVKPEAYDPSNTKSIQNMFLGSSVLPERITELAGEIDLGRSDESFKKLLGDHKDYKAARRLRLQFWSLFNTYASSPVDNKIAVTSVYAGIVTFGKFHNIVKDDKLATFIFSQPLNVRLIQEDLLYEGYRQMEEIMEAPIYKADGVVDPRIVAHKLKIINMLEDRINGSVVQRSQNYVKTESVFDKSGPQTPEELESVKKEIEELRKTLGKKDVIDAEFVDVK